MRTLLVLVLTLVLLPVASAQRDTGFDLLRLEPSARAAALAGTVGSAPNDDPASFYYNPALLDETMHRGLSVTYLNHLADVNAGFATYARTVQGVGTVAAGLRYLSYGDFARTAEDGTEEGSTFGAGEAALSLSASRQLLPRLQGGATLHAAFAWLDDASAQAVAADVGVLYSVPSQLLHLSASIHNVGIVASSLGSENDTLPVDLRVGVSKGLRYIPLTITLMGYDLTDFSSEGSALDEATRHVALGGEFRFGEALRARLGYNPRRHEELATGDRLDLAGLSLGFGLALRRFGFDYAFNSWSQSGGLHQLSIRTRL